MFVNTFYMAVLMIGSLSLAQELPVDIYPQFIEKTLLVSCTRAGVTNETVIKEVKDASNTLLNCLKKFIDVEVLKNEIEQAKPIGALDEVFKKYCDKSSELKTCFSNFVNAASPCVDKTTRAYLPDAIKASHQLLDFICNNDGDRIALFIAEKGPECFKDKVNSIQSCYTTTKEEVGSSSEVSEWQIEKRCKIFDKLSKCIVKSLEECDTPTPANMMESLFRFIRKGSPCKK